MLFILSFAIKDCYAGLGKADPNSAENKKVVMLEDYCKVSAFDEMITRTQSLLHNLSLIYGLLHLVSIKKSNLSTRPRP